MHNYIIILIINSIIVVGLGVIRSIIQQLHNILFRIKIIAVINKITKSFKNWATEWFHWVNKIGNHFRKAMLCMQYIWVSVNAFKP